MAALREAAGPVFDAIGVLSLWRRVRAVPDTYLASVLATGAVALLAPAPDHAAAGGEPTAADLGRDVVCPVPPGTRTRAGAVWLHAGGFVMGFAIMLRAECRAAARAGIWSISVEYPHWDYPGALAAARRAVRRVRLRAGRRPIYAAGQSSGGSLALTLLNQRAVSGAAVDGSVTDFRSWGGRDFWNRLGVSDRGAASPVTTASRARGRALLMASPFDNVVPAAHTRAYRRAATQLDATYVPMTGFHCQDGTWDQRAIQWMRRR
jgi:alpha/beta hydrolase family protein